MIKIEHLEEEIAVYDITVKDNQNFYANNILVHNCAEIMLPTQEVQPGSSKLIKDLSTGEEVISEDYNPGLIALCNLSSINLMTWKFMSEQEKESMTYNLLRASDNLIDYAFYPAKEGERFNRNYRAIGVGVTNYARFLADSGLHFGDKDAEFLTSNVTEDIYWYLMNASIKLAGERGRFEWFDRTKYAEGKFSHDLYQGPHDHPLIHNWDALREKLLTVGARFATVMAVAPTATSASLMKSTEGIEPIRQLVSLKTGTYSCKQLAPDLTNLRANYDIAWDIDPLALIRLNSIRQRFVDQGQSFSLYYKDRHDSATAVLGDIIYSEDQGVKSLYYAHTPKESDEDLEACESCSA